MTREDGYIKKNGRPILDCSLIRRGEEHNIKNLMLAIAACDGLADDGAIRRVCESFHGLAHRCEKFLSCRGIDFYDSSIDTSPARTATTLRSLGRSVVIILGGRGKGLDYSQMLPEIKKYVKSAVLLGENKQEIKKAIGDATPCRLAENMAEATRIGIDMAREVGALLLSPASASYDAFKNYEERGDSFKKSVTKELENEEDLP